MKQLVIILCLAAAILGAIAGIFSFLLDLLVEIFTGAGIYGIITVVCVIIFIIAVRYIING